MSGSEGLAADGQGLPKQLFGGRKIAAIPFDQRQVVQNAGDVGVSLAPRLLENGKRLSKEGLGAGEIAFPALEQGELVHADAGLVILLAESLSANRQRFLQQGFGTVVESLVRVDGDQLYQSLRDVRVLVSKQPAPE